MDLLSNKRYNVCVKIKEGDELVKKFEVLLAASATDLFDQIKKKFGVTEFYKDREAIHTEPGILYVRPSEYVTKNDSIDD